MLRRIKQAWKGYREAETLNGIWDWTPTQYVLGLISPTVVSMIGGVLAWINDLSPLGIGFAVFAFLYLSIGAVYLIGVSVSRFRNEKTVRLPDPLKENEAGPDHAVTVLPPRDKPKIVLGLFWFMRGEPSTDDLHILYCDFTPERTLRVERVTVQFNRPGGNGSFELARYEPHRIVNAGERYRFELLHQRKSIGAFWGDPIPLTEYAQLDKMSKSERSIYINRKMNMDGPINCLIVITLSDGTEVKRDISILAAGHYRMLNIIDDAKIQPYDPNRVIPSTGMFAI